VSNLGDLLKDVTGSNSKAVGLIGDVLGTAADISGAVGLVADVIGLFAGGDPTQAALQNILTTIQNDFHQLNADLQAENIINTYRELDDQVTSPAQAQLQQLQSNMKPDIVPCITAIDDLALNADAFTGHWQQVYDWQIFWTDLGQHYQLRRTHPDPGGLLAVDAGYGPQTPPQTAGQVFSYRYVLPDCLRMTAIFIAVAGTVDPNWVANYKTSVLTPVANFLKTIHDTILGGITQLSPGYWDGQTVSDALTPPYSFPGGAPFWSGVSQIPPLPPQPPFAPTGANIEFGAVEKYSGYSSMGNYQISFQDIPITSTDPSPFNKFQIRLLKRAIDVYQGVGLLHVWNVINSLNALVGASPMSRPSYAGWSFRKILEVSKFAANPTTKKFSLYGLAKFIRYTLPLDTKQDVLFTSFQELLSH